MWCRSLKFHLVLEEAVILQTFRGDIESLDCRKHIASCILVSVAGSIETNISCTP
jgi:hypothetical protein